MRELSIKEEQQYQYEVLKYFDSICQKENISYFLFAGTLLGAVREHNFIDWDDDIDICMTLEEYKKLEVCIEKYKDKRYFFQTLNTDKYFFAPGVSRICINDTLKWEDTYKNAKFHKGIYFDIFIFGYADKNIDKDRERKKICLILKQLNLRRYYKLNEMPSFRAKLNCLIAKCIPIPLIKSIYKKTIKLKDYNYNQRVLYIPDYALETFIFDSKIFEETIRLDFGEDKYPCPKRYDEMLRQHYGDDYMIPRKTKPIIHKAFALDK